jgi:probable F420-dependent oxidoreductase
MVLAYTAWDLARYSNGRFMLGLGTQVKGHNEHRFDVESQPPGPRLRDVLQALRHIFDVFQGEEDDLDYDGEFYSFSLMPPFFKPAPIENPDIPIHIAGVNEYNLKLAGELADGLAMHTFNTPKYIEDVIIPNVKEGCERGDRSLDDVELIASPMTITGQTDEEMKKSRENAREQISFYGSTRSYHDVFEAHGLKDLGEELHDLSKQDEWKQMHEMVTDDVVDEFAVEAPIEELGKEVRKTYGDTADRVGLSHDFNGEDYWEHIVDDLHG